MHANHRGDAPRRAMAGAISEALDSWRQTAHASASSAAPTRRRFLQGGLAAAMLGGMPWLAGCGGGDDNEDPPARPDPERRTMFFNHSHLDHAGKSMFLRVGEVFHPMTPVAEKPDVLARERRRNSFLAAVPDTAITHVVEDVAVDATYVMPIAACTRGADGRWTMDGVYLSLPASSAAAGFTQLTLRHPGKATAKRRAYGLQAAASSAELHEEQSLYDAYDHAAALMTTHSNLMSYQGDAANTVVNVHVMNSNAVGDLRDAIVAAGTASVEATPGTPNASGWASLRALIDPATNQPRVDADGLLVCMPVFNPKVVKQVAAGIHEVLPQVQDDESLGADVSDNPTSAALSGKLWSRQDGKPNVKVAAPSPAADANAVGCTVKWPNGQNHWFDCAMQSVAVDSSGNLLIDFILWNTGMRYLSVSVEFLDEAGNLITLGDIPGFDDGSWVTSVPNFRSLYTPADYKDKTRMPIGGVNCIGTVFGVPVMGDNHFWGSLEFAVKLPSTVHTMRVLSGGLGTGSNNYPDTIAGGVAGTVVMNYGLTSIFGAFGAVPGMDAIYSVTATLISTLLNELAVALLDKYSGNDLFSPQFMIDQGMNLINFLLGTVSAVLPDALAAFIKAVAAALGKAVLTATVEKVAWFVGIVFAAESAAATVVDFALTTAAIAQSPFTYVSEISVSHDIALTIQCDPDDTTFPKAANAYRITATYDDAKPNVTDYLDVPRTGSSTVYTLANQPFGGNVTLDVQFVQRPLDGSNADVILLGQGTTGSVKNNQGAYTITIKESPFPIQASTQYQHQQRTALDGSGAHVWDTKSPAPTGTPATLGCGAAGEICSFDGIAVRQGTSSPTATRTMLAYSWSGQDPSGGGTVHQLALMDADAPATYTLRSDPSSPTPVALSRTPGGPDNYYIDTSSGKRLVRGIYLDASGNPTYDGPGSNRAFGLLNSDSTRLLVHPSGQLVSVAGDASRIELLTPDAAPVSDAVASTERIAQVLGLTGTRVGCMQSVISATIANDGTLLVLEGDPNNRIQAFDLGMNPTQYFQGSAQPYFLSLDSMPSSDGWLHLDIQADATGLLYVLSHNTQTNVYQVSVYDSLARLQKAVSTTTGVNAARIGLDHWRNLYTLNYDPIAIEPSGSAPATTEPSVSLWTPCNAGQSCKAPAGLPPGRIARRS